MKKGDNFFAWRRDGWLVYGPHEWRPSFFVYYRPGWGIEAAFLTNRFHRIYARWTWAPKRRVWEPAFIEYPHRSTVEHDPTWSWTCPTPSWGVQVLRWVWPGLDRHLSALGW